MVNYNRTERIFFYSSYNPLLIKKKKFCLIFLFFLAFLPALLSCPAHAFGMDKIAVLPFKIESAEPAGNLSTHLQEIFSQEMENMGYQTVSTQLLNSILGDTISYSDPKKEIIPLGKANNADWIVIGELTENDGSIQLNVKVLDPDSAKTPFSAIMIEKDRKNLPESTKKIAESLGNQMNKKNIISKIIVKGSKRADEDAILNIISSEKGDQFDKEKLDRDLRTIYKMGFFDDVNYDWTETPSGKIVTFNLAEKPTIIKIAFEGNDRKKDDKLMEELGIRKYSVRNDNEIKQSVNRLLEFYRNDGYYKIEIDVQIKNIKDENEAILTYKINEGEKVHIKDIVFNGNKIFDDNELKKLMLTKEKGWLTWFTNAGVLDKKKLEFDLQRLRIYYDNHGYIKSQIGDPEITYDEEEEGLKLTIPVIEGSQYKVNDIIITGEDLLISADDLRMLVDVKKGDPFSRQIIYTEIEKIKALYADLGYYYAEAPHSWEIIEGTDLVNVTINIKKFKKVRIERINIYGNEITRDKVFRRELKFAEGEYFSNSKLERSKANLDRIDIFENHEVKIRNGSSDDTMIIDITGEEQLRRSISFSAGYGGWEKFMFSLQYANNNLFGRGQNISLDAMVGGASTRFNITLMDPWLFDKPVRGSITAYNMEIDYDFYTRKRIGLAGGIGFLLGLDDFTRGTTRYAYDKSRYTDIDPDSAPYYIQESEQVTSSVTVGVERNSKDKWWNTSKGSLNYFTFEYAGGFLGGDAAFNKYILSSTFYLPMPWSTVFVINAELGLVRGRSGGSLPHWEKFFLGGIDSVRGYEWSSISPLDEYGNIDGGTRQWLYKLEYRFPLVKGEGLTGLIFMDTGNAYNNKTMIWDEELGAARKMRWNDGAGASVGFGLRWRSPMGPLRLEYGYKLKDNINDTDSGRFEFSVSSSY